MRNEDYPTIPIPPILNPLVLNAKNQDISNWIVQLLEKEKSKQKLSFKKDKLETWGEDEVDSNDKEDKDEQAFLCLMALDHESNEVFDPNFS